MPATQLKSKVRVVFTGGTISMQVDPVRGGPIPVLVGRDILARVPGLNQWAEVSGLDFSLLPGPHMTPDRMFELAGVLRTELARPDVDGIVVTHGTDTLEETAFLLDLLLDGAKPVVLVGAMRNSSESGWDGPSNLLSAVRVAASPDACGAGVLVVMNERIFAGREAVKTHTESVDGFAGRDWGASGVVDKDRVILARRLRGFRAIPCPKLETAVEVVKLSAGSDGRVIESLIRSGIRGLVIEGLGRGNVPVTAVDAVDAAVKAGVTVVITTRCAQGRVLDTYAYDGSGRHLLRLGALLGGWLPAHKARLLLMVLLGGGASREEIAARFDEV